jgi:hypothetical protein
MAVVSAADWAVLAVFLLALVPIVHPFVLRVPWSSKRMPLRLRLRLYTLVNISLAHRSFLSKTSYL